MGTEIPNEDIISRVNKACQPLPINYGVYTQTKA